MTQLSLSDYRRQKEEAYKAFLDKFDSARIGIRIFCPGCRANSWIKLVAQSDDHPPGIIGCPRACGAYGPLEDFSPTPCHRADAGAFDLDTVCSDGTRIATNGVIFQCPRCGIQNVRQAMSDLNSLVLNRLGRDPSPVACADLIAKVVSTFDGVMRAANRLAVANAAYLTKTHPAVSSFQNVASARAKFLPLWDMATAVSDWPRFVLIVQKRHLFAHALGVADEDYIRKSGDTSVQPGSKVAVSPDDATFFADAARNIVRSYYGHFLS